MNLLVVVDVAVIVALVVAVIIALVVAVMVAVVIAVNCCPFCCCSRRSDKPTRELISSPGSGPQSNLFSICHFRKRRFSLAQCPGC